MARTVLIIPINENVGLNSVSVGLASTIEQQGNKVGFLAPLFNDKDFDGFTSIIKELNSSIEFDTSFTVKQAEELIASNKKDELLENIVAYQQKLASNNAVVVIQGFSNTNLLNSANLNYDIAKALNADVVFVASPRTDSLSQFKSRTESFVNDFDANKSLNILGIIVNKINTPRDELEKLDFIPEANASLINVDDLRNEFAKIDLNVIAAIEWNPSLLAVRTSAIAEYLNATIVNAGEINSRRITNITFCSRSVENAIKYFKDGSLIVTTADRPEILLAASLAAVGGMRIAGILLTGQYDIPEQVREMCKPAFTAGLPVMAVNSNTWQTAINLHSIDLQIVNKDADLIRTVMEYISKNIDFKFIESLVENNKTSNKLSTPAFRHQLTELAVAAGKTIVLPEGDEPRTIQAAIHAAERKIAKCVLLADPVAVQKVLDEHNLTLPKDVGILNPDEIRENYVPRLVKLRESKGMTEEMARDQLGDNVVLGTMMLEMDEVDGLVSGAVHTTANTIRPPLQLIKTAPNSSIVSSVFFMLLPDEVLVYGDCAVNPDPTAEQLAEIAIQSADSAKSFGIEPRVAMISYSTGTSGKGADVEKVALATKLAQEKRPDLLIDGPLQYDAATAMDVARTKAPNSPVAGQATVFVFPDLNTGNTTYKAVQRSSNSLSIGPMLQGMRKPVNDLSRGALVEDIVYTIAITAIQAMHI